MKRVSLSAALLCLPLLAFLVIPLIALFLRVSPQTLQAELQTEQVQQAVLLSLTTSLTTVLLTLLTGTPVAYLLAQTAQARGREYDEEEGDGGRSRRRGWILRLIDSLIDLPTVLPPAVAGLALLMAFGRQGLLGGALRVVGITLPFTPAAVVLAQTFVSAPLYVRAATLGFAAISREVRQAAALDGATGAQTFLYVALPLAWLPMLTGLTMTWARALGEFGATLLFAGNFPGRTQTMPLAIYLGFETDLNAALALSFVLIVASFAVLVVVKAILARAE